MQKTDHQVEHDDQAEVDRIDAELSALPASARESQSGSPPSARGSNRRKAAAG
jgi:hypothetical protein